MLKQVQPVCLTPERSQGRALPALCGQRFSRAVAEHARDRVVLGRGDPQPVLGFHRDLAGDVGAPGGAVGWLSVVICSGPG
jgi:hypothetical protein